MSFHSSHSFEEWRKEILCQLSLILPVCFSFIFRKSIDLVSVIFVGHLGAQYLAASGLATVTANVTGNSMVIGFAGALSTQCSQLFSTKNELAINTVLPRAILIVCCVVTLPVSILWLQSRSILQGLGQSEQLAINAGYFLVWLIPGIWAFTFSMCIQNWLHAQSKTKLVLLVTIVTALLHPCFCYVLIYTWNYGYIGAAIASSLSKTLELCLLSLCVFFFSTFRMIWSWALLRDWVAFLRLGVPGLMMMTEWWASEIIIFLSGFLSNPDAKVSAMAIYQNTLSICFMIPSGE